MPRSRSQCCSTPVAKPTATMMTRSASARLQKRQLSFESLTADPVSPSRRGDAERTPVRRPSPDRRPLRIRPVPYPVEIAYRRPQAAAHSPSPLSLSSDINSHIVPPHSRTGTIDQALISPRTVVADDCAVLLRQRIEEMMFLQRAIIQFDQELILATSTDKSAAGKLTPQEYDIKQSQLVKLMERFQALRATFEDRRQAKAVPLSMRSPVDALH